MRNPYPITQNPAAPANPDDPCEYHYGSAIHVFEPGAGSPPPSGFHLLEGTQTTKVGGCERARCASTGGCTDCPGAPPCDSNPTVVRPCTVAISTLYKIGADLIDVPDQSPPELCPIPVLLASEDYVSKLTAFVAANPFIGQVVFHIYRITSPGSLLSGKKIAIPLPPTVIERKPGRKS
jgi:hypothetical protein